MLIVVTSVSLCVHIYSSCYMSEDPSICRFLSYLSLFTFFMLVLISSDNFIVLFLGWEGVGLCSYLLISFWFTRISSNKAALKAMIVNRVGDCSFSLGIFCIYYVFRSFDFHTVFTLVPYFINTQIYFLFFIADTLTIICILLFIGSVAKSAQVGLHTWLPDAMEGPTPVSALIHAATMVTAGVFLLIRCSPLFEYSSFSLLIITFSGAITCFFASTIGIVQNDLKKVIAYSTCSQLGYMIFACGLSNYNIAFFHLFNHAFFKALLFLSAGSIIHSMSNEQDMRKMGGLLKLLPFTYSMVLIGSLSLMGFPFLSGFYSKDLILEIAFANLSLQGYFSYWMGTSAAFFTAFYSFRLIFLVFWAKPKAYKVIFNKVHELSFIMAVPLMFLCLGSIFSGFFFKDLFVGPGTCFFQGSIFILPSNYNVIEAEFSPTFFKMLPTFFSLLGASCSIYFYSYCLHFLTLIQWSFLGRLFYLFLLDKWFFDILYNIYVVQFLFNCGFYITYIIVDKGFIENIGPFGIINFFSYSTRFFTISGILYNHALFIFLSLIFLFHFVFK